MIDYNVSVDGKKIVDPTPINEIMHYTYYNALYLFLKTENSPKNLKKFRYKSVGESIVWGGDFKNVHPSKLLLFYAMLEEIKKLSDAYREEIDDPDTNKEKLFDLALRFAIVGHVGISILKKRFFDFLPAFGEGGDALRSLIYVTNSFAVEGRVAFFWNEENGESNIIEREPVLKDMTEYLGGVIEIFENSDFFNKHDSFLKEISGYIDIIKSSEVMLGFYSIKDGVTQMMVDPTDPDAESNKKIMFFDRFPLWTEVGGDGSMFSFLFQDLLDRKTREYILLLEYTRIYMMTKKGDKSKIRDSAFNYVLKMMMDRNSAINDQKGMFDRDFKRLSEILLSGGTIKEQRRFFALAHNKKTVQKVKLSIEKAIIDEGGDIDSQFKHTAKENDGLVPPSKVHELMKLFFINVMEKIERLLADDGYLIYEDFTDDEIRDITIEIVLIIQQKIPDIIRRGGIERSV